MGEWVGVRRRRVGETRRRVEDARLPSKRKFRLSIWGRDFRRRIPIEEEASGHSVRCPCPENLDDLGVFGIDRSAGQGRAGQARAGQGRPSRPGRVDRQADEQTS